MPIKELVLNNLRKIVNYYGSDETAITASYRPCGVCMKEAYKKWKDEQQKI